MAKKKGNRYFVWIILALLFVGLIGFGGSGLSGNIRSIGSVGEKDISVAQYQRAINEQLRSFSAQIGQPVGFQQAQAVGLDRAVLAQLISNRSLDNEATTLGVSVGDERVKTEVLRIPGFQGLSGSFDREIYARTLSITGQSETEFEAGIRDDISRTLLQGAVVGGIPAPGAYADALVQFIGEKRNIVWAVVTETALTEPLRGTTDADLQTYYDAHPENFTQPEVRNISFAWLTPEMIQDDIEIDPVTIRELYDDRIGEFIRPERRLVERLVYSDEAAASDAIALVENGESDFDALVEARGLNLADVDMGDVDQSDLDAAGEAVFAASAGDVVGPFASPLGPAIFRMNAILSATEITFEDAQPDLREELASARARRIIEDGVDDINDLLAGGATVQDLAERTDLELGTIAWSESNSDNIAAYENFRTAAAAIAEGDFAELRDLADGGVFALQLDSITAPTLQSLDEVSTTVAAAWQIQAQQEAVMAQAQTLAGQIQPLTNLETLGLSPTTEDGLTRRSFVEGTPPGFMGDVFNMEIGEVIVIDRGGNGAILVRLDQSNEPDPEDDQTIADLDAAGQSAAAGIAQDIFEAYSATIQSRTDVALDQNVIDAVHAQFQ